jgi:hypothetical protein
MSILAIVHDMLVLNTLAPIPSEQRGPNAA